MNYQFEKDFLKIITQQSYYDFLKNELKKYNQHGKTSIFKHSRNVAFNSYKVGNYINKKFGNKIDIDTLIQSAYMHDLFMYDWH